MSETRPTHSAATRLTGAAGLLLLAVYALPLLSPPDLAPHDASGALARIFPGVAGGWVAVRLVAVAVGAGLLAAVAPLGTTAAGGAFVSAQATRSARRSADWIAIALGAAVLAVSPFVAKLSRAGEALFLVGLFAPALVISATAGPQRPARPRMPWLAVGSLVACWAALRLPLSLHSPRAADLVDTWLGFEFLDAAGKTSLSLVGDGFLPGMSALYLHLQGAALLGSRVSFPAIQVLALLWIAATAFGVARLAVDWIGRGGAIVATAVFLFAPFTSSLLLGPTPYYLGPGVGVAALLLADAVARRGSSAALVALAPLLGVVPMIPLAAPPALFAALGVAVAVARGLRFPTRALAAAGLAGLAAAVVALPSPAQLAEMRSAYVEEHGSWSELENVLLGQAPPQSVVAAWRAPAPPLLDVPIAGLLAPFAVARTPLRAWADSLLDPIGGALVAVGAALCVGALRRSRVAAGLLLLLGVCLLPGLVSSFDRPSLTRSGSFLIPAALLAGLGANALGSLLGTRSPRRLAISLALAVALGGTWAFDVAGPRVLRQSSLSIAIEAAAQRPDGGAVVLDHPERDRVAWLRVPVIAAQVPSEPIEALAFDGADTVARLAPSPGATRAVFWSPALERQAGVASALCTRHADAELFQLADRTGRSHAWAARIGPERWRPALSPARIRATPCREARLVP